MELVLDPACLDLHSLRAGVALATANTGFRSKIDILLGVGEKDEIVTE